MQDPDHEKAYAIFALTSIDREPGPIEIRMNNMLQAELKRVPEVHYFLKHTTAKHTMTAPDPEDTEEEKIQNFITLPPLITNLLL